jgi:tRNA A-37 threonylcarbamoyl transferase component Bud32
MAEFPFQLTIKCDSPENKEESLLCTGLYRAIPGKRAVYDAMWKDTSVVIKVFSHKFKARLHFKRELKGLNQLQNRGLSSVKSLFSGKTHDGRWAIVLEKIVDSATILDVLNKTAEKLKDLDLLIRVCRELAKQHNKGVLQKDLHLGNYLLAGDRIYALDPSQMQFFRHQLPRNKSISQLALLLCSLPISDIKSVRVICQEYFEVRGWHVEKSDETLLQKKMALYMKRGIRRSLKKTLRTSKGHLKITNKQYSAVFDKGFYIETELLDFVEQLDTLMDSGQVLKDGNTCYVSRLSFSSKDIVVKRYNNKGFLHSLRHTIKRSRARRGWLHGHRLGMLNIATPKPLAYIEQRRGLLVKKSYLVTQYVEGQRLYEFLRDDNVTRQQQLEAMQMIKTMLDKLAKYQITHGDLKHTNILITEIGPVLTDLDGMIVHCWELLYRNRRTKDIERFIRGTDISIEKNPTVTKNRRFGP